MANQRCQRLVQGMNNTPELFLNHTEEIEIPQEGIQISYRCKIKVLVSPLHFKIGKLKSQGNQYFEVFLSTKTKEPN